MQLYSDQCAFRWGYWSLGMIDNVNCCTCASFLKHFLDPMSPHTYVTNYAAARK